ncbi:MAG: FHA domain-containing protein [Woeseiaceae bacterium]
MANENKKINELVSDDDDPTSELDASTFRQDNSTRRLLESDDATFDIPQQADRDEKTVRKLQYDIEQLRSKWTGLETELKAREAITAKLNTELDELRQRLARKDKLIKSRDGIIKALKAEIREREEHHRHVIDELKRQVEEARLEARSIPEPPPEPADPALAVTGGHALADRLARTEAYADLLRRKLQDVLAQHDDTEKDRRRLSAALTRSESRNHDLEERVSELNSARDALDSKLDSARREHEHEIRMLRFELGEAQETVSQTEELNSQLASDLIDSRGFKDELERMLCDSDEQSRARISELESELEKTSRRAQDLEEKLDARSNAINVLLTELARKADQIESIDGLGEAISDLDLRMSEQFEEANDPPLQAPRSTDRVTRVLLGKIGDKLLRFPLFKDRLTIGRSADNDIQLNAPFISRKHAVVTTDGETTRVIDWGSMNGVYVNSSRVTEHFLKNGDIVTIGNAHFRYDERPMRDA